MGIIEIFLIGVGLAMDAFAVSICRGIGMPVLRLKALLATALCFGFFQALMPTIGYFIGEYFEKYIVAFDHWIAFLLLGFIGGKMILDVLFDKEDGDEKKEPDFSLIQLLILAVATSIDALAVGISFAFLRVSLLPSIFLIGITTFVICSFGVLIGHRYGAKYKNKATVIGGIILIAIGTKILIEHLFFS